MPCNCSYPMRTEHKSSLSGHQFDSHPHFRIMYRYVRVATIITLSPIGAHFPSYRSNRYEEYSIVQNAPMSLGIRGSWGYVSISFGRALAWHSKLTRFYPAYLHQKRRLLPQKVGVFLTFLGFSWFWVNIKVNRKGHFRPMSRRKDGQDGLHSGKGKRK